MDTVDELQNMNNTCHIKYHGRYQDEVFLKCFLHQRLTYRKTSLIFRNAIRHQVVTLRRELREQGLLIDHLVLDHHPVTFSALKWIFLKVKGFKPNTFTRHHLTVDLLRDWQCFHGALAEYRVVTRYLDYEAQQHHFYHWSGADAINGGGEHRNQGGHPSPGEAQTP